MRLVADACHVRTYVKILVRCVAWEILRMSKGCSLKYWILPWDRRWEKLTNVTTDGGINVCFSKTCIMRGIYLRDTNMSSDNPMMIAWFSSSIGHALQNVVTVTEGSLGTLWFETRWVPSFAGSEYKSAQLNFLGQSGALGCDGSLTFRELTPSPSSWCANPRQGVKVLQRPGNKLCPHLALPWRWGPCSRNVGELSHPGAAVCPRKFRWILSPWKLQGLWQCCQLLGGALLGRIVSRLRYDMHVWWKRAKLYHGYLIRSVSWLH
jgi:hypothetical protein